MQRHPHYFQGSFTSAGLPYSNPHSFRKTLTQLGERICHTPEQFKAWNENLGHETVLTTFSSYGEIARERQAELIRQLGQVKSQTTFSMDALDALLDGEVRCDNRGEHARHEVAGLTSSCHMQSMLSNLASFLTYLTNSVFRIRSDRPVNLVESTPISKTPRAAHVLRHLVRND